MMLTKIKSEVNEMAKKHRIRHRRLKMPKFRIKKIRVPKGAKTFKIGKGGKKFRITGRTLRLKFKIR